MSGNTNKLIAFNYFGGKFTYLDELYEYFPVNFTHLIDLFAGSCCVSLNYKRNCIKTAVEINGDITNFFEVLRNNTDELIELLERTPVSELEYQNCWDKSTYKVEQARRFYVRVRMSSYGLGAQRENKSMHLAKTQLNATGGETVSKWVNAVNKLDDVAKHLRENFQIINDSALTAIDRLDFDKAFFYVDPPYHHESRTGKKDYKFEFSDEQHCKLSIKLHKIKGKAMISGYECQSMNYLYKDWYKVKFAPKKKNIRSSSVQECIWMNYDPHKEKGQYSLI